MPTVLNLPENPGVLVSDSGEVWKIQPKCCRRLKIRTSKGGTRVVSLPGGKTRSLPRLVLETFLGPSEAGQQPLHLNGDPSDNRLENLAWVIPPKPKKPNTEGKPEKPYDDFPLFAHSNGRWAKKAGGKLHYFGTWGDWREALDEYKQWRDAQIGNNASREQISSLTVGDLTTRFMADRRRKLESGELSERSVDDYERTCELIKSQLGKNTRLDRLNAADFEEFRAAMAVRWNLTTLGNQIGRIRVVFNFAGPKRLRWIPNPESLFGGALNKPSRKSMRLKRSKEKPRELTPEQIRAALPHCSKQVRGMVMLGINCALGNTDCALLTTAHVNLETGWLDYPRPKTGVARRAKLWPETIKALRTAWESRPEDTERMQIPEELLDRFFITRARAAWVGKGSACPISHEFRKALREAGVHRQGLGFYALRHTFQTVAEECKDFPAIGLVMGHVDHSMAAAYRERISDDRLELVAETVRKWWTSAP